MELLYIQRLAAAGFVLAAGVFLGCGGGARPGGAGGDSAAAVGVKKGTVAVAALKEKAISCESGIPGRFAAAAGHSGAQGVAGAAARAAGSGVDGAAVSGYPDAAAKAAHPGMLWIPGGTFNMGADN